MAIPATMITTLPAGEVEVKTAVEAFQIFRVVALTCFAASGLHVYCWWVNRLRQLIIDCQFVFIVTMCLFSFREMRSR